MNIEIEKVINRHKGDPDYKIKGSDWSIWIYPHRVLVKDRTITKWEIKSEFPMFQEHNNCLYHLLETKGTPSVALLYLDYMKSCYFTDSYIGFAGLTEIKVLLANLLRDIIYHPEKIHWTNYP